jgi:hypothetical protein
MIYTRQVITRHEWEQNWSAALYVKYIVLYVVVCPNTYCCQ